jgi:hypothetical protein
MVQRDNFIITRPERECVKLERDRVPCYSLADRSMGVMSEPHTFSIVNVGSFHIKSAVLSLIIMRE